MKSVLLAVSEGPLADLVRHTLRRFDYEWTHVDDGHEAFQKILSSSFDLAIMEYDLPKMDSLELLRRLRSLNQIKSPPSIVITRTEEARKTIEVDRFHHVEVVPRPLSLREFVFKVQEVMHQQIQITCLGGGTGLFTLLSGLKTIPGVGLSSIVSMSDDGGSTGKLRDMFGILPPGDVRRSLVALSTAPDLVNELIQYRFKKGPGLEGHNLGNLLLTALAEMQGSMSLAVKSIGEILNIQGSVIPVTEVVNTLKAELGDGTVIEGESRIDLFEGLDVSQRIEKLWQEPIVPASPDALEAIYNAKFIILGPGDLYTSIISNLIVEGIRDAILSSKAKKIYICNVMTKPGETPNFQVSDHVAEVIKFLSQDVLDYVVCSSTPFDEELVRAYSKKNQIPVVEKSIDKLKEITRAKVIFGDIASGRELVRHDSLKLSQELKKILLSSRNYV